MRIGFKKLHPAARVPTYGTKQAAGADLYANIGATIGDKFTQIIVGPGERRLVKTGIAIELPAGLEAQIRPRSGLAFKSGVTVLNAPGTIDADYRGDIGVILLNTSQFDFVIADGDRIAQLVIAAYVPGFFVEKAELHQTARGEGGFGSTGVSA
ncbi:dUTP diphosphatase [Pararhizobium qamdonense]|uniref:dUTP diphosphatase n=1 Tax=Pararhizobium qamdonense TaxID=3031126 RepID=UPI0023E2DAAC|nr:dUTP diphosphatase [Pararhizobium qamdonense]